VSTGRNTARSAEGKTGHKIRHKEGIQPDFCHLADSAKKIVTAPAILFFDGKFFLCGHNSYQRPNGLGFFIDDDPSKGACETCARACIQDPFKTMNQFLETAKYSHFIEHP
jgi:hypothetical protein